MGPKKSRIGPQLPESAYITCKSGGYLPVSGGQLALVMAKVTTTWTTVGRTLLHTVDIHWLRRCVQQRSWEGRWDHRSTVWPWCHVNRTQSRHPLSWREIFRTVYFRGSAHCTYAVILQASYVQHGLNQNGVQHGLTREGKSTIKQHHYCRVTGTC